MPAHIFLDFDQTLSKQHTAGKCHSGWTAQQLRANLKSPDKVAASIRSTVEAGNFVYIATFHQNKAHIAAYMQALLGEDWRKYIRSIQCADSGQRKQQLYVRYNQRKANAHLEYSNKNDYIRAGLAQNGISDLDNFDGQVFLVDDDNKNLIAVSQAQNALPFAVKTVPVDLSSDEATYLDSLNRAITTSFSKRVGQEERATRSDSPELQTEDGPRVVAGNKNCVKSELETLYDDVQRYLIAREDDERRFHSDFISTKLSRITLFFGGYEKEDKTAAARALLRVIKNHDANIDLHKHLGALRQGELGKIIRINVKTDPVLKTQYRTVTDLIDKLQQATTSDIELT